MNISSPEMIAIGVAIVVVILIIALLAMAAKKRKREREQLKQRYGAEYARTVDETGSKRKAEEHLSEREARREQFDIRALSSAQRTTFRGRFEALESSFLDSPDAAVRNADALLDEVAEAKGYPDATADQRLEDLAVDHPSAVDRYRKSRPNGGQITTEEHRQALIGSRSLFESLVGRDETDDPDAPPSFSDIVTGQSSDSNRNGVTPRDEHSRH